MIAKKSEHTTYMGVLLFSASPKFDCTPFGGGPNGVFDNCSGVSSAKTEDMISLCFKIHTAQSIDDGCKEAEVGLVFLLRSRREDSVCRKEKDARELNDHMEQVKVGISREEQGVVASADS